jgi:ribonuclease P protein component
VPKDEKSSPSRTNNFPGKFRLYGRDNIRKVFNDGERLIGDSIKLYYVEGEPTRFAISVPKSYGKAVARNRIKRVIREFLRLNKDLWHDNRWVIIKITKNPDNEELIIRELKTLMAKIK